MSEARGDVRFSADGSDYVLTFDFNALVDLQEEFDCDLDDLDTVMGQRAKNMRTAFRVGLARHQPNTTDVAAGEIMSTIGVARSVELLAQAMKAAFPAAEKSGGAKGGRPPKARAASSR